MATFQFQTPDGNYEVEAPDQATAVKALQGMGSQQPSTAADVVKSGGAGVARGAASLVGLPGTIADAINTGGQWALRKGYQAATGEEPQPGTFFGGPKPGMDSGNPLSGAKIQGGMSTVTGGATNYQPSTVPGEYARTVGEFLPAGLALGGLSLPSLLGGVAAPALSSETAGQATKGTPYEPYARFLAGLGGGLAGTKLAAPKTAPLPTAADIKTSAGYADLKAPMKAAQVDQQTYVGIVKDLWAEAGDFGLTTKLKGEVSGVLTDFAKRAQASGASLHDLEVLRRSLRNIGGDVTDKTAQSLSGKLIEKLDNTVENLSAQHIATTGETGTPVIDVLKQARSTYQIGAKSQKIENAVEAAKNAASGFENGLRIEFRKLLKPGNVENFTEGERKVIEQVTRGSLGSNALRWLGGFGIPVDNGRNFLGSVIGGGVGSSIGSAIAGPFGALVGGPALMGIGTAAKLGANAATRNSASLAEAMVKAGPQASESFGTALAARQSAGREALLRAALQSGAALNAKRREPR